MSAIFTRFSPIFDEIAQDARARDREDVQPYDAVRQLADAGFGALRLPTHEGGFGASIAEQHEALIELGAADSNLPQIWRNHFAFVEDILGWEPSARAERWRERIAAGAFVGGAWSETGGTSMLDLRTTVSADGDAYAVDGTKFYSTGSLFADWISVLAKGPEPEQWSLVLVQRDADGVSVLEDWDGVGQRLTGSGTSTFDGALARDLYPFAERSRYQEAFYQLNHLATLAGIARSVHRELVDALRDRTRAYPQALATVPRDDGQLQQVVGRVAALASSAEASVYRAATLLDRAADAINGVPLADVINGGAGVATNGAAGVAINGAAGVATNGAVRPHELDRGAGPDTDVDAQHAALLHEATIAVYEAQLIVTDQALEASTIAFDALGSSALRVGTGFDRHWRNARTVASHNPRVYKARIVGDWHLNGTDPIAALLGGVGLTRPHAETGSETDNAAPAHHVSKELS